MLNYYLSDQKLGISSCDLKTFRDNFQMKSAIVLIILKLYNNDRKYGNYGMLAQPIEGVSKSASKIIVEYAYLFYGKETYYSESLHLEDIMIFLKNNPSFLKVPQIKNEYDLVLKPIKKG